MGSVALLHLRDGRVKCSDGGVKVEVVPWAQGKSPTTTAYAWFLARWAKKLSWQEVARSFNMTWDTVFRAVSLAAQWGLEHRELKGIRAIGVDEVLWHRGHKYLAPAPWLCEQLAIDAAKIHQQQFVGVPAYLSHGSPMTMGELDRALVHQRLGRRGAVIVPLG